MNKIQFQLTTVLLTYLFVRRCNTSVTVTVNRNSADRDYFTRNSTDDCAKFSAKEDSVPNSCVCEQNGQVGTYQAKKINGRLQQNCEYNLETSEGMMIMFNLYIH